MSWVPDWFSDGATCKYDYGAGQIYDGHIKQGLSVESKVQWQFVCTQDEARRVDPKRGQAFEQGLIQEDVEDGSLVQRAGSSSFKRKTKTAAFPKSSKGSKKAKSNVVAMEDSDSDDLPPSKAKKSQNSSKKKKRPLPDSDASSSGESFSSSDSELNPPKPKPKSKSKKTTSTSSKNKSPKKTKTARVSPHPSTPPPASLAPSTSGRSRRTGTTKKYTNDIDLGDISEPDGWNSGSDVPSESESESESESHSVSFASDNDEDVFVKSESGVSVIDMDEEPPKRKRGGAKKKTATKKTTTSTSASSGKVKMSDHFDPINNPQNFRDSYADVEKYADPCGQEAHDDIIKRLLCTQYDKVGKLLEGFEKTNNLGEEGVKLQTACSGTDAPALALTFFQEAAERHGISFKQSHEMSCEIEPFKQAYLQNNFDSIIYPDIGKLTDTEGGGPRDIFGILQPIPDGNFFVAGTVCKNFSSMRGSMRIDIEDKGQSGETFLAAVNFLEKEMPAFALFENVLGAPWEKMDEYITGKVPVYLSEHSKKSVRLDKTNAVAKEAGMIIKFVKEDNAYVADEVGGYYGVKPGQKLTKILRFDEEYDEAVEAKDACLKQLYALEAQYCNEIPGAKGKFKYINIKDDSKDKFMIELPVNVRVPSDFKVKGKKGSGAKQVNKYYTADVEEVVKRLNEAIDQEVEGRARGEYEDIEWSVKGKSTCTLAELKKVHSLKAEKPETTKKGDRPRTDYLIFEKPCQYKTHLVKVDTKDYGLPQTRQRCYLLVYKTDEDDDDLGYYYEHLVRHLKEPVKHPLEAFILNMDHEVIRRFREALLSGPGRFSFQKRINEAPFWDSTTNANLPHNVSARRDSGMEQTARFATTWDVGGKHKIPHHWWNEYIRINGQREKDCLEILCISAMRDAEAHDANWSSFFWNISQNATKEKHRSQAAGVAGCVTPGGDVFLPHLGRCLLGAEKLLLQGIPYFRLQLANETEVNMSDLAGNAMSLSVVSACMLAALTARKFKEECVAEAQKKKTEPLEPVKGILNLLQVKEKIADAVLERAKMPKLKCMDVADFKHPKGDNCLDVFSDLSNLGTRAFNNSVLCCCESSGRVAKPEGNRFLWCKNCGVSSCADCAPSYAWSSHKCEDICFTATKSDAKHTDREVSVQTLTNDFTSMLPAQLYVPKKAVEQLAAVQNDIYGVKGLENFVFNLGRVMNTNQRWKAMFTAKPENGTGNCVAQIEVTVGNMIFGGNQHGLVAKLFCYQPTLDQDVRGKIEECMRLYYPAGGKQKDVKWEIRGEEKKAKLRIIGSNPEKSTRIKMGLTDKAVSGPDGINQAGKSGISVKPKKRDIAAGDGRRWQYAKNWKECPKTLIVKDSPDTALNGTYEKTGCELSTPQSVLWVKKAESKNDTLLYILLNPNVSRVAPDQGIISESPSPLDSTRIRAKLDYNWQPCDALVYDRQQVKMFLCNWTSNDNISVVVPVSDVKVKAAKLVNNPKPDEKTTVATITGLKDDILTMLKQHCKDVGGKVDKLNMFDGIESMETARTFETFVSPPLLKFASSKELEYNLGDKDIGAWLKLTSEKVPFGTDEEILPPIPPQKWIYDVQRSEKAKGGDIYTRRPDPEESKKFKQAMACRPHGWEVFVSKKGEIEVNIRPHVLAHLAASALLNKRGLEEKKDVIMEYRLSDIKTQSDPVVDEFKISNTDDYKGTVVNLKGNYKLYPRQEKALTKLLQIDEGDVEYKESEMSEQRLPGTAYTLNTRASREAPLRGGVLADAIGAGKTVISIGLILKGLKKSRDFAKKNKELSESAATLIVVPPGLINQWEDEFKKFVDKEVKLKVLKIYNLASLKELKVDEIRSADAIVLPIDLLEGENNKTKGQYLDHLFKYTEKKMGKKALSEMERDGLLGGHYDVGKAPECFRGGSAKERVTCDGVWVPFSSADPYGGAMMNQQKKDLTGFFTERYAEIISMLRSDAVKDKVEEGDKGVPLEFFNWNRIIIDEIHESLCSTKEEIKDNNSEKAEENLEAYAERNRGAARELLGVAQHDPNKRPLRARGCVFGLTGTPLLDSENRVIELANLMGGSYITSLTGHWRRNERDSGRDNFLHLWLEPTRSRMYRFEKNLQCSNWMACAMQRNKAKALEVTKTVVHHRVCMSEEDGRKFLDAQPNQIRNFVTMPIDYDAEQGQDPRKMLQCNATLQTRKDKLLEIVANIRKEDEETKIICFADIAMGGYGAAKAALGVNCSNLDGADNETKNKIIGHYKNADVTDEDRRRPRVLLLTFAECAGLNLQLACYNVIFFQPMFTYHEDKSDSSVEDCSKELQALGRVYRTGQTKNVKIHKIICDPPESFKGSKECKGRDGSIDFWANAMLEDPATIGMATNTGA
ncbi:hypothetical protein TrLO_g11280 [Triparma laevis f. longispina]|uniref:Helicase ATP-binding domain-containing protein n=1 Tax=Triparma laevis f. longispina TaxID=1714387 RepID=A0A9W6ZLY6_9STRA|nr:hypothetical protein TrLO_g11280 [Triparma laevis f. longispina]